MTEAHEMQSLLGNNGNRNGERNTLPWKVLTFSKPELKDDARKLSNESVSDSKDISFFQAASEGDVVFVQSYMEKLKEIHVSVDDPNFITERDKMINSYTACHMASRYNQVAVLECLLKYGAPIDQKDEEDENTALMLAIKYNSKDAANLLLMKYHASVSLSNKNGYYPLHFAARRGNKDLCEKILSTTSQNINEIKDKSLGTPLHSAVLGENYEVVEYLIQSGASVEARNKEGEQPLHLASAEDNPKIIVLLTKGAICDVPESERRLVQINFVNAQTDEKDTALHIAVQAGRVKNVKTLVSIGAKVNMRTDTNQTPLHLAAIGGQLEVARYLVMNNAKVGLKDNDQMTALHKACQFGHVSIVKLLLENGARYDVKEYSGYTPIMCAVWKGHNEVIKFLVEHEKTDNKKLLGIGDPDSLSILHLATKEDQYETVQYLLSVGGKELMEDAFSKDNSEGYKSCVHYAVEEGKEKMLVLLLKHGASVDVSDIDEKTPLHTASELGNLSCVQCLAKEAPGIINATDAKGMSALHLAAMNGHYKVVEELIERGAEISSRDEWNWTPLDYAARYGFTITMRILIENEAKIDALDTNFATPLHHAAQYGHAYCVRILLDNNANVSAMNMDNKTCLDLAVENNQRDVCLALITHLRWKEILQHSASPLHHGKMGLGIRPEQPIKKLIMSAPEIAEMALNKCIKLEEIGENSRKVEYRTIYDTSYLDFPFDLQDRVMPYFGPSIMVQYNRNNLLQHPVTVKLINAKWAKMGRMFYFLSLMSYIIFVTLLTQLVVVKKQFDQENIGKGNTILFCRTHNSNDVALPWLTFTATMFQIFKELVQAYFLRMKYVKDPVNWFEFLLYTSTFLHMLPFIICQAGHEEYRFLYNMQWNTGAVAILFAWFNLLLYLKRAPFFGLYVIMFTEVLSTLVMVIGVFSILVFGFSLAFLALFQLPDHLASQEDGINAFNHVGTGIVRTLVMMIGELDYRATFTEKLEAHKEKFIPHQEMGYIVFIVFVIIMTIVVMNLLVGLAIGDIEAVRNNAYIRMLRSQVKIIEILQRTFLYFPRWRKFSIKDRLRDSYDVTIDDVTEYPSNYKSSWQRFTDWIISLDAESLKKDQREMTSQQQKLLQEIETQQIQLDKQKKTIRKILKTLEKQSEIMEKIVESVENLPEEESRKIVNKTENPKILKRILSTLEDDTDDQ